MAPAACDTILQNLMDFGRGEKDYDRIITGDLGYVGQSILFDLLRKKRAGYQRKSYGLRNDDIRSADTAYKFRWKRLRLRGDSTLAAYIMPS